MKKFFAPLGALALLLPLASCSSDQPLGPGDGNVTISVKLPKIQTRAFGDTVQANMLAYAVYDEAGNVITKQEGMSAFASGNTETINVQLVPGVNYNVLLYAFNNAQDAYTLALDGDNKGTFSVNYANVKPNDETYDAFYNYAPLKADGSAVTVELRRPFAQLNLGTDDSNSAAVVAAGGVATYSSTLTISSGLLKSINLMDPTNETQQVAAETYTVSTDKLAAYNQFPEIEGVSGMKTIDMNYLLVAPTKDDENVLLDGSFNITRSGVAVRDISLASMPVRANWRTNIYGSLLTIGGSVSVKIIPGFDGNVPVSDAPAGYTECNTPDDLYTCLRNGTPAYVPEGTILNLSSWLDDHSADVQGSTVKQFYFDKTQDILVEGTLNANFVINFTNDISLKSETGKGVINFDLNEQIAGLCLTTPDPITNPYSKFEGKWVDKATLEGITLNSTNDNGVVLEVCAVTDINLKNAKFVGSEQAVEFTGAKNAIIENCTFISENSQGLVTSQGINLTMNNCICVGGRGGLNTENNLRLSGITGNKIINGGFYAATNKETATAGNWGVMTLRNSTDSFGDGSESTISVTDACVYSCNPTQIPYVAESKTYKAIDANVPGTGYTVNYNFSGCYVNSAIVVDGVATNDKITYTDANKTVDFGGTSYSLTKLANGKWTIAK